MDDSRVSSWGRSLRTTSWMKLLGDEIALQSMNRMRSGRLVDLGFLRLLLELALDLAHQRGLADAPDAHDREVAVRGLQDAAHLELAAEEARAGDRLAGLVRRQQRQVELRCEAVEQLAGRAPRLAHGLHVRLVEHEQRLVGGAKLLLEFVGRALDDQDGVALGQRLGADHVRQALGQLARAHRRKVRFLDQDQRRAIGEAQLPVREVDEVHVIAEHFLVQLDLVPQRAVQQLEEIRHRLTPRCLDRVHDALPSLS